MSNLQIAPQKTDSTLSIMMNEIQEIRKSQEHLGSKYEEIKDELKTMQNINKNLEYENAIETNCCFTAKTKRRNRS